MTKITVLGDVHGMWSDLNDAMRNNKDTDMFIQVGDLGICWDGKKVFGNYLAPNFNRPFEFIGGNHDNWDALLKGNKYPKNISFIPNAHRREEILPIRFMGGAYSIDKAYRKEGISWWSQEIPPYSEFQKFADLEYTDTIITHTCPESVAQRILHGRELFPDTVSKNFEAIWRMMDKKPKLWLFGHFHLPFDEVIDGTRFICIPCVHEFDNVPPSDGVTLTVEDGKVVDVEIK